MAGITDFSGQVDQKLATQPAARAGINTAQRNESTDYLNRFRDAIGGQETTSAMYDRIGQELGVPTLRANAQSINNTYQNIPYTYSAATRGYDVNANQLSRLVGTKQAQLAPALQSANDAATAAEGQLTARMGLEQAQQQKELIPFQTEASMLSDRLAREYSGFNTDSQNELETYIQKMQSGIALSEGEKNRANQLAMAKLSYDAQMKQLEQNASQFDKTYQLQRDNSLTQLASLFNQ